MKKLGLKIAGLSLLLGMTSGVMFFAGEGTSSVSAAAMPQNANSSMSEPEPVKKTVRKKHRKRHRRHVRHTRH